MKTSYFGNIQNLNGNAVSIARFPPRTWGSRPRYIKLAPSRVLFEGKLSEAEYRKRYQAEVLANLDPKEVYADLKDKILCCYEKPGIFCHRRIVAEWIEKALGVKVPEI